MEVSLEFRMRFKTSEEKMNESVKKFEFVKENYERVKRRHVEFVRNGTTTEELVTGALFLAKLDIVYRRGITNQLFEQDHPADISDLRSLLEAFDVGQFRAKQCCFLNPDFGEGSKLVGGADADFIIDDTLIDIKTTKLLTLKRSDLNQLICYYVLSLIGGISERVSGERIKRIGIYFSRYGLLWTSDLSELGDSKKFEGFKEWLIKYVDRHSKKKRLVRLKT
ncbi:MAG: hypothetical protein AB7J13_02025 [Pyrinomonadaceae bacterium]